MNVWHEMAASNARVGIWFLSDVNSKGHPHSDHIPGHVAYVLEGKELACTLLDSDFVNCNQRRNCSVVVLIFMVECLGLLITAKNFGTTLFCKTAVNWSAATQVQQIEDAKADVTRCSIPK